MEKTGSFRAGDILINHKKGTLLVRNFIVNDDWDGEYERTGVLEFQITGEVIEKVRKILESCDSERAVVIEYNFTGKMGGAEVQMVVPQLEVVSFDDEENEETESSEGDTSAVA